MEEQPKVDILLTTYNSDEKYLTKQIDSILNQTYKNIKLYISDDASTDKKVIEILNKYKNQDDRIVIYTHEKNMGFNKNFAFLLEQSTSDYIMFSDHDDIWYKDKVKKSIEKIKKENVSMVYVNARQIDENDKTIKEDYFKYKNMPKITGKNKLAISRCVGIGCSQIITKEVKEKMLPIKPEMMAHDWLAAFVANECKGIDYIEEPLFGYRLHSNNVFGGRSFSQNINRWKKEKGKSYNSYKEYRSQVINNAYLSGAKMCLAYSQIEENRKFIHKLIQYYESIYNTKIINTHLIAYFKFLGGKNLAKKMLKEIIIFHFPIIGYLGFKIM